jgi:hypothetical protein
VGEETEQGTRVKQEESRINGLLKFGIIYETDRKW